MRDDFVYVQEAETWSRVWLWDRRIPEGALTVDSVLSISESPRRLPVELANRLYAEGETGMGYYAFALVLRSGREVPCLTGNAVDFMDLPADLDPRDVVDVRIGTRYLDESESGCGGVGKWCFYAADPSKQFITHPHLD